MKRCTLLFVVLSLLAFAVFAEEPKKPIVLARADSRSSCVEWCASEQGMCFANCDTSSCHGNCIDAHSRCLARCYRR